MLLLVMLAAGAMPGSGDHTCYLCERRDATEDREQATWQPVAYDGGRDTGTLLPHSTSRENISFFQTQTAKIGFIDIPMIRI